MRSWLHSLVAVQSNRPAWALGLRMATIVVVPLCVGVVIGELGKGLIATLGALNVAMADPGGADRLRARALLGALVAEALMLALGSLAGSHTAVVIPAMFVVAFAGGMAGAYGDVVGNVAFLATLMFIIGTGLPGDASDALQHSCLVALGGGWAILLSLALWPLRPLRPAQLAVGAAFGGIAAYLGRFGAVAVRGLEPAPGKSVLGASEPRAKLAAARETLELVEGMSSGVRPAAQDLDALLAEGEALLARCEALGAQVVGLPPAPSEALRDGVAQALLALAGSLAAVDRELAHPRRETQHQQALGAALEALDAAIAELRAKVAEGRAEIRHVVAFRGVELTLREAAALAERSTALAEQVVRERHRRATAGAGRERRTGAGPRAWVETLRGQLTPHSALLRHSLRFGVAMAAGLAIAALFDLQHGYWIDITIAVILRPYIVTTFERGLQRIVGTLLGGFLAAGLLAMVSGDVAVLLTLAALAFATFAVMPLNYGWAVTFLTPLVVLLVGFALGVGTSIAFDRIVDTLIGGALAVAAALLLWPRSERGDFATATATTLETDRAYLDAVLAAAATGPPRARAAAAADDLERRYRRLVGEPRRGRQGLGAAWEAVAGCRRLYVATAALETQLGRGGAGGDLQGIAAAMDQTIDTIAAAFRERRPPPAAAAAMDAALAGLRGDVSALAERRMRELVAGPELTATSRALQGRALVLAELDACSVALHRLESAARVIL